jgi:hypothetical protein
MRLRTELATDGRRATRLAEEATRVMVAAAWHGRALPEVGEQVLALSQRLARRHLVERRLLNAYRQRFSASAHRRLDLQEDRLWANLSEVARRLRGARVEAVFIKSGLEAAAAATGAERAGPAAPEYGDFDLVVGAEGWRAALGALEGWGKPEPPPALEPHKLMIQPEHGPGAHLHRDVEWFGVPVISAPELRARSRPLPELDGLLLPTTSDELRLWVAHAVFQNIAFDLSELLEVDRLADPDTVAEAQELAAREGWGGAFADALACAQRAAGELDAGGMPALPLLLPTLPSLIHGWRHAGRLFGAGRHGLALREIVLRPALVTAKRRRRRLP